MTQELDDILLHFGKKGMKWGVRKAIKGHVKKRKAKQKATLDKYHEKKKGKKTYTRMYNKNFKKTKGNHYKSVRNTRNVIRARNRSAAIKIVAATAPIAIKHGSVIVKSMHGMATSPQAVRTGKNIIQAAKRSPIRYVDGRKMTNVI